MPIEPKDDYVPTKLPTRKSTPDGAAVPPQGEQEWLSGLTKRSSDWNGPRIKTPRR
ncbi:hypothetical protein ACQPTN_24830 [Bradyrhizobium sp. 13971]